MVALVAGGHVLIEGVPGVAKTLTARSLAAALSATFSRIQFTPDLMPADITGVNIFEPGTGQFRFRPGPLFADIVLADEINRAPAKTQSALLEAMQENQVSIDGVTHTLSGMLTVLATQNPIEYEGTYPLPEAQLDRFMIKIVVDYPALDAERMMIRPHASAWRTSDASGNRNSPRYQPCGAAWPFAPPPIAWMWTNPSSTTSSKSPAIPARLQT